MRDVRTTALNALLSRGSSRGGHRSPRRIAGVHPAWPASCLGRLGKVGSGADEKTLRMTFPIEEGHRS